MRPNKLRELLKADKPTLATHIHTTWPSVIEAIGHTGVYDYVEFVGEYGPYDLHDLDNMCRAAELYDMSMMIKVDQDGGTYGVATRRFTYMGYGGTQAYVQALREIVVTIMIEKPGTVNNLEEVLAVPGVDMVQWGGSDYSMGMGRAGERSSPEMKRIERRVFETSLKMGVPPRAEINSADQAKEYLDMGVRHFCIGTDINILHQWWKAHGDNLRKALDGH